MLAELGAIDLAERRNRLLRAARRALEERPAGGLHGRRRESRPRRRPWRRSSRASRECRTGWSCCPGCGSPNVFPDEEWDALGPDENGRGEATHPQYHLKLLLDRIGVARGEVQPWRRSGGAASSPARGRAVANAMAAAGFLAQMGDAEAGRAAADAEFALAELPDPAAEAQAIALALARGARNAGQDRGAGDARSAACRRVSALLARWGIEADDSAGQPLSETPPGTLLLGIAAAAAEELAPVALLALLKHPLVGGEGDERLEWLEAVRELDLGAARPAAAAGLAGLDAHFDASGRMAACPAAARRAVDGLLCEPVRWRDRRVLAEAAQRAGRRRAWRGPAGRMAAELLAELQGSGCGARLTVASEEALPVLRQLLDGRRCGRLMAGIRAFSSGACSKRGCSAPTWSFSAA